MMQEWIKCSGFGRGQDNPLQTGEETSSMLKWKEHCSDGQQLCHRWSSVTLGLLLYLFGLQISCLEYNRRLN